MDRVKKNESNRWERVFLDQQTVAKPSLFGMIWSPGEQFERMREQPKIWLPLIIITLISAIVTGFSAYLMPDEMYQAPGMPTLSEDELGMAKMIGAIGGGIGSLFAIPITILMMAAIMLLVTTLAHTGATFKQLLSLNIYVYFITVLGLILNVLVMPLVGGDPSISVTSLNSLVNAEGLLGGVLSGIEVFALWTTILTAIGLHQVAKLSKGMSWTVAIVFYLVGIAITVGSLWINEMFSGMAGV